MKYQYIDKNFSKTSQAIIDGANSILDEYSVQGYILTLRQLYYQFVSRDLLPNTQQSYKRLGSIISDGRLAGLIDWKAIEDRTRNLASPPHWDSPAEILDSAIEGYQTDQWANQPSRVEVWIEKEALAGIIERACERNDVPYIACKGYMSLSEMWRAAQRIKANSEKEQNTVILHLGDHDPSGIDMTRDIEERLETFGAFVTMRRIALNQDQIEEYDPPPNPAKITDSRFEGYEEKYGDESWELDALEPRVIVELIASWIKKYRDQVLWKESRRDLLVGRKTLRNLRSQL